MLTSLACVQDEIGETCVTVLVTWENGEGDNPGQVHFEAFQCSDITVKLQKDGWLQEGKTPNNVTKLQNPKEPDVKDPVIVAGKDVGEVDTDYFLVPMKILDHSGFFLTSFPVENMHIPQVSTTCERASSFVCSSHFKNAKGPAWIECTVLQLAAFC
jgi:hypothetical protein